MKRSKSKENTRIGFDIFVPKGLELSKVKEFRQKRVAEIILRQEHILRFEQQRKNDLALWAEFNQLCEPVSSAEYEKWFVDYLNTGGKIHEISTSEFKDKKYYKPVISRPTLPDMNSVVYSPIKIIDFEDSLEEDKYYDCYEIFRNPKLYGTLAAKGAVLYKDISPELFDMIAETYSFDGEDVWMIKNTPLVDLVANRNVAGNYLTLKFIKDAARNYPYIPRRNTNSIRFNNSMLENVNEYYLYSFYENLLELVGQQITNNNLRQEVEDSILIRLYYLRQHLAGISRETPLTEIDKLYKEISLLRDELIKQ